jgi:hypothetical protein
MQSAAPLVMAFVAEHASDAVALAFAASSPSSLARMLRRD